MLIQEKLKNDKGFTLIELLVVIAIIALLLSILMPGLRKAKRQVRAIVCRTNLRSLVMSQRMYSDAYDASLITFENTAVSQIWLKKIGEYLADVDKIRYCPETSESKFEAPTGTPVNGQQVNGAWNKPWGIWNDPEQTWELGSYGINNWTYGNDLPVNWNADPDKMFYKITNIRNTAIVPAFLDCMRFGAAAQNDESGFDPSIIDWENGRGGFSTYQICRLLINRHIRYGNVAYMDGHADKKYLPDYFTLSWHKNSAPNSAMVEAVIASNPPGNN